VNTQTTASKRKMSNGSRRRWAIVAPLDFRLVGRMLLHAACVGAAAGLCGCLFVTGCLWVQHWVLEIGVGYRGLQAYGERATSSGEPSVLHPWRLLFVPALGAGLGALCCAWAPEARGGGGGNAMIRAFHLSAAQVRLRVLLVRALASMAALGSGASGGAEGPTMQMGSVIGCSVARLLRLEARERRILYIAGVAAGMSAVFRTPLGAAMLAIEILYRDDFEAEALVPAISASVVGYGVSVSLLGESMPLFGPLPHFSFHPTELPLYAVMALCVAAVAVLFVSCLHAVHHAFSGLAGPYWCKPVLGGLGLGAIALLTVLYTGEFLGPANQPKAFGLGVLGSGYGDLQLILGMPTGGIGLPTWNQPLPGGWHTVGILLVLLLLKLVATCLSVGSGASAGDFAPSLVLGGLAGGAFGHAAAALTGDPSLHPAAFALVGMATFYGGIAHAPVSALLMACELAGSYDLLVPLMLCESIAFLALRNVSLYPAQLPSLRDSPAHRHAPPTDRLTRLCVADVFVPPAPCAQICFDLQTPVGTLLEAAAQQVADVSQGSQRPPDTLAVRNEEGLVVGCIPIALLHRSVAQGRGQHTVAADLMLPLPAALRLQLHTPLQQACASMVQLGCHAALVVDVQGQMLGFLHASDMLQLPLLHQNLKPTVPAGQAASG
jgi:CIC family chloride channel protein